MFLEKSYIETSFKKYLYTLPIEGQSWSGVKITRYCCFCTHGIYFQFFFLYVFLKSFAIVEYKQLVNVGIDHFKVENAHIYQF